MVGLLKKIFVPLMMLLVAGCGGESAFVGPTDAGGGTTTTTTGVRIGSGSGSSFQNGVLSIGLSTLSAGGTTSVTASLVKSDGAPYVEPVEVSFSSNCTGDGTATLESPVTTNNGKAVSTYTAVGCTGNDLITAIATVDSEVITAAVTVNVLPATVGSIQFVSATPTTIAIKGTGGSGLSETSTVVFKVFDNVGGPVINQLVNFELLPNTGEITLSTNSGMTNAKGEVQTIVNSGTISTTVRVKATVDGTNISTQSVGLSISTGTPDQNSFQIALETLNPEAWEENGIVVPVTAYVADHFQNPAPDGTAVTFQAEGGFIDGSCLTVRGQCSVNWVSNAPRPADARVTILASTIGEESFVDKNPSDGWFGPNEDFTDMPEAFRDDNENDVRDPTEEFLDYNNNDIYDGPDGLYNGPRCIHPTLCGSARTPPSDLLHVRSDHVLVMASAKDQMMTILDGNGAAFTNNVVSLPDSGAPVEILLRIQDIRGQVPPAGGEITASIEDVGKVALPDSTATPNTNQQGPLEWSAFIAADPADQEGESGLFTFTYTNADETVSKGASISVVITDVTPPGVTASVPVAGTSDVDGATATIKFTFDDNMDATTIIPSTFVLDKDADQASPAPEVVGQITYDPSSKTAIFIPSAPLTANTFYKATILGDENGTNAGVRDNAGNEMPKNFSVIFKTKP